MKSEPLVPTPGGHAPEGHVPGSGSKSLKLVPYLEVDLWSQREFRPTHCEGTVLAFHLTDNKGFLIITIYFYT